MTKSNRRYVFALAVSCLLLLTFSLVSAQSGVATLSTASGELSSDSRYLVQLNDAPAVRYDGGVRSLVGTSRDATGTAKFQGYTPAVEAYTSYLSTQQAEALSSAEALLGRSLDVPYNYYYAVNGFATFLTAKEAQRLSRLDGVQSVTPLPDQELHTDRGPQWIGATNVHAGTGPGGFSADGEGTVIGIIDTGLNMLNETHPSFADVGSDGYDHTNPLGAGNYRGWCDPGDPDYDANLQCNDKVIGAYDFAGTSPDDVDGHGSHVASTAAGNVVDDSTIAGPTISVTKDIMGVAPHANIIIYGVEGDDGGCCNGGALLAAIDQITQDADIVDGLNYSIGGGDYSPWDAGASPLAFLNAVDAGLLVVTSAGNGGPNPQTLGSPGNAPWMLTIGSTTHDRALINELVDISDGTDTHPDVSGAGFTSGHGPATLIYAGDVPSDETSSPELCGVGAIGDFNSPWPAGTFNGEIVICRRGTFGRVEKGANALAAGAGGFILVDNGAGVVSDAHVLPGLHVTQDVGDALITYVQANADDDPMGTITGSTYTVDDALGDIMSGFSSRGPQTQASVIKPDVAAPGSSIWAAYADDGDQGNGPDFTFISGTSMASPHTAGATMLLRSIHPDWSVTEIYSALALTGKTDILKEDGVTPADPFDYGGGRIQVDLAANAHLVLNETTENFEGADPADGGDPAQLNLATMLQDNCLGSCTWTRTFRATQDKAVQWDLTVEGMMGYDVTVTPATFTLTETGQTQEITVQATVNDAAQDQYVFGSVVLTPTDLVNRTDMRAHGLHMSMGAKAVAGDLPDLVTIQDDGTMGTYTVSELRTGAVANATYPVHGMAEGSATEMSLALDQSNGDPYDNLNDGTVEYINVTVGADSLRLVAEVTASTAPDIDLFVGTGSTPSAATEVCASTTPSFDEYCNISGEDLSAGTWWILVQNWAASEAPADDVTLVSAVVEPGDLGNLDADGPATINAGEDFDIELSYNVPGAVAGDRFYGAVYILPETRDHIGEFDVDLQILAPETLQVGSDPVGFELGVPSGWSVTDDAGNGLEWATTNEPGTSCELSDNWVTASGQAACVNSDEYGNAAYDTSLISNEIMMGSAAAGCDGLTLDFMLNFIYWTTETLDIDVSSDSGANWSTLLSISGEDVGAFKSAGGGVQQSLDMADYLSEESVHVRFRYYNPTDGAWDYYAQVDNVELVCQTSADISVNPTSITQDIAVGETAGSTLTIESVGTADLEYNIFEDGGSAGRMTPYTLTQSTSQAIEDGAGVSCGQTGIQTTDNEYLRVFDLSTEGLDLPKFDIQEVQFGIDNFTSNGPAVPLTANIYVLEGALSYDNMTLVGSGSISMDASIDDQIVSIPVVASVTSDSVIVVGVEYLTAPSEGYFFFPGGNSDGQSGPSYIAAPGCGIAQPTDYAAIGFADLHLVMNVLGETSVPQTCDVANDISWLSVSPASGVIPAGSSEDVTVSFDATGLTNGIYTGTLCVGNNSPTQTVIQVPVQLNVYADILDPTDVALGEVVGAASGTQLVAVMTSVLLATFAGVVLVRRRRS